MRQGRAKNGNFGPPERDPCRRNGCGVAVIVDLYSNFPLYSGLWAPHHFLTPAYRSCMTTSALQALDRPEETRPVGSEQVPPELTDAELTEDMRLWDSFDLVQALLTES